MAPVRGTKRSWRDADESQPGNSSGVGCKQKSTPCDQEQEKSEKTESDPQTTPELELHWEWEDDEVWNIYSQNVNAEITKAFRSGKHTIIVTPTDNDKFCLDLKKMVQQNTKTGAERRIRVAVKDQESYFVWHWEGDDDSWIPYNATICLALETAWCANEKSISSSFGKTLYTLDLAKMVQINANSHYKRKMKRKKSEAVDLDADSQSNSTSATCALVTEELPSTKRTHRGRKRQPGSSQTVATAEDKNTRGDNSAVQGNYDDKESVKTLLLKGKAPVDPECTAKLGKVEDLRKRARYLRRDKEGAEHAGAQEGPAAAPPAREEEDEEEEEQEQEEEEVEEEGLHEEVVMEEVPVEVVPADTHLPHTSSSLRTECAEASPEAAAAGVGSVSPGPTLPATGDHSLLEEQGRLREQVGRMEQRLHALEGWQKSIQHALGLIHAALEHAGLQVPHPSQGTDSP